MDKEFRPASVIPRRPNLQTKREQIINNFIVSLEWQLMPKDKFQSPNKCVYTVHKN